MYPDSAGKKEEYRSATGANNATVAGTAAGIYDLRRLQIGSCYSFPPGGERDSVAALRHLLSSRRDRDQSIN